MSCSSHVGALQFFLLLPQQLFGSLQRSGLRFQAPVAFRELLLLALQLFGQSLRLLQQLLGPHRGFDRVEHDAHAFDELIEEREVDFVEAAERRQFDDGLNLSFKQHRQHDDVQRRRFAQTGVDADVVGRDLREQDALLLECALPDEPFAVPERLAEVLPLLVGVARDQLEERLVLGV